jgi:D-beta-D-heptose 7-phosphate kinase/D-beta-D-heptose 1-phosphate adenosyltransferase
MKYDIMVLSGGFDPIHKGHISMIKEAATLANTVIVGVNSDEWLKRKKGKPFMDFEQRKYVVENIKGVSMALGWDDSDDTAAELLMNVMSGVGALTGRSGAGVWSFRVAFGNGGDRKDTKTIPAQEVKICSQWGIDMVWGVGGGKIESSSNLLKEIPKWLERNED